MARTGAKAFNAEIRAHRAEPRVAQSRIPQRHAWCIYRYSQSTCSSRQYTTSTRLTMPDINQVQAESENMSTARLPLVDMSAYLDPASTEEERRETAGKLDKACRDFGFFYVTGHGLDPDYLKSLLKLGHRFFELPDETKDAIHIFKSQDGVRGYQKIGENVTYAKRDQQEVRCVRKLCSFRPWTSIPSPRTHRRSGWRDLSNGPATKMSQISKPLCSIIRRRCTSWRYRS